MSLNISPRIRINNLLDLGGWNLGKDLELWKQIHLDSNHDSASYCVTMGKLLKLSEPHFLYPKMERKNFTLIELLSCLNNTMSLKGLAYVGILYLKTNVGKEQRASWQKTLHTTKVVLRPLQKNPDPCSKPLLAQPIGIPRMFQIARTAWLGPFFFLPAI